ncbi:hypothetical protein BF14_034330 [Streptomyces griseus]|uniref:hypothetical protein n=1 Tax=Streptomyces globisporus TaxID=1908 RepID=UPI0005CA8C98|nr:hypothetical protein [Streptomyces globisporus]AWL90850.1 hypothetical protein DIJ69_34495 [Streptomyces globisporus]PPA38130.1 hypothetical protein BF14_034330 [Streptomyces griseus]RAN13232.1 hypothetical protein A3838_33690 [Streptomyces badius]
MTYIERTADICKGISPALAWAQLGTVVMCITLALILGLKGSIALGIAIAGIGAALVGGIQITVHIRTGPDRQPSPTSTSGAAGKNAATAPRRKRRRPRA